MSDQLTLTVCFTRPGDVRKNTRQKVWKMDLPVTAVTDSIQDLLLTLIPENEYGGLTNSYTYTYPGEKDFLTNEDLPGIVKAINAEIQEKIEESLREEQERKEKEIERKNEQIEKGKVDIRFVSENELPLPKRDDATFLLSKRAFWNGNEMGYEFSPFYGFGYIKDEFSMTDKEWKNFENKVKIDFDQKRERASRLETEKNAREEAEKAEREKARKEFVANWAETNGSGRLKAQLHMGYDGLTLFYQEKLAKDFPELDAKLMRDASVFDCVSNPTIEQLAVETKAAQALVHLEIADSMNSAKLMTRIAFDDVRDEDEYGDPGEKTRVYYVVVTGYRVGPKGIFPKEYTVAIQL